MSDREVIEQVLTEHHVGGTSGGYGGMDVVYSCQVNYFTGRVRGKWHPSSWMPKHQAKKIIEALAAVGVREDTEK